MRTRLLFPIYVVYALAVCQAGSAGVIGNVKANCADGEEVHISGVVAADLESSLCEACQYVQDADGCAGIKVYDLGGFEGIEYGFTAVMGTDANGERFIQWVPDPMFSMPGSVRPKLLVNRCVGGGPFCHDPNTGRGQCGVDACVGLNNVGLLVKTCGRVTAWEIDQAWFYVDDGSLRDDGTGHQGLRVSYADFPAGGPYLIPKPAKPGAPVIEGDYVAVTGISSVFKNDEGEVQSVIRLRRQGDIDWYYYGSGW